MPQARKGQQTLFIFIGSVLFTYNWQKKTLKRHLSFSATSVSQVQYDYISCLLYMMYVPAVRIAILREPILATYCLNGHSIKAKFSFRSSKCKAYSVVVESQTMYILYKSSIKSLDLKSGEKRFRSVKNLRRPIRPTGNGFHATEKFVCWNVRNRIVGVKWDSYKWGDPEEIVAMSGTVSGLYHDNHAGASGKLYVSTNTQVSEIVIDTKEEKVVERCEAESVGVWGKYVVILCGGKQVHFKIKDGSKRDLETLKITKRKEEDVVVLAPR